jgi:hypothetical protein
MLPRHWTSRPSLLPTIPKAIDEARHIDLLVEVDSVGYGSKNEADFGSYVLAELLYEFGAYPNR